MYILSETQINSLLDYRQKFGKFLSIYEIQAIPDFDLATIRKILPFHGICGEINIDQDGDLSTKLKVAQIMPDGSVKVMK